MTFDKIKGLSPAMQSKYWKETIHREAKEHVSHSLNTDSLNASFGTTVSRGPPQHDFYGDTWKLLMNQYDKAAGAPSPMVFMARRNGGDPNLHGGLPLPLSNRQAMSRSLSTPQRNLTPALTPQRNMTPQRMPTPGPQRMPTPMQHNTDILRVTTPAMSEHSRRSGGAYSQGRGDRPLSRGSSRSQMSYAGSQIGHHHHHHHHHH